MWFSGVLGGILSFVLSSSKIKNNKKKKAQDVASVILRKAGDFAELVAACQKPAHLSLRKKRQG